jgi:lysophospholipase L1-like esterase
MFCLLGEAQEGKVNKAVTAAPRDPKWVTRHEGFVEIAKKGGIDVLFMGDSITDGWGGDARSDKSRGTNVYKKEFGGLKIANFGIGGDRTEHVLWRLQNGELDGIQPKVMMLMIGTNNSGSNSAEEIADGVKAIVAETHKRSPKTKVLLLAIFPRATGKSEEQNKATMDKLRKVNDIISKLDDGGKTVKFMDIGSKFTQPDWTLSTDIMYDRIHLTDKGYQIWADAVKEPINQLLNAK